MKEDVWVRPGAETIRRFSSFADDHHQRNALRIFAAIRRDYAAHTGDETAYDLILNRYVVNPQTIGVN